MINRFEEFTLSIFKISHYWNALAAQEMEKYDLKGISALYLLILHNKKELTAAQLAQICCRDKADISRVISAFKKRNWIEKQEASNKYRALIKLSTEGQAVARQLEDRAILALNLAGQGITSEKRESMYECLNLIANQLEEISKDGLPNN